MDVDFARQYYESASSEHWWFQGRKSLVGSLIERYGTPGGRYADLGAGAESLLPSTIDVVKLDIARPEPLPDGFVQASAEALPFKSEAFDGVGLFDVLEHLDEPDRCLREVRRVVRPGGLVIVTVPAYQRLWSPHDDLVGHKRRYRLEELTASLSRPGLDVLWSSAFYGFLLGPAVVRTMLKRESPMVLPSPSLNLRLTRVARRSAHSSIKRPTRWGLSLAAVATVN